MKRPSYVRCDVNQEIFFGCKTFWTNVALVRANGIMCIFHVIAQSCFIIELLTAVIAQNFRLALEKSCQLNGEKLYKMVNLVSNSQYSLT